MLSILASGTLVADPKQRTTAAGKAYATASMRVPAEDSDAVLVSVIAFAADAVAAILALSRGETHFLGKGGRAAARALSSGRQGAELLPGRKETQAGASRGAGDVLTLTVISAGHLDTAPLIRQRKDGGNFIAATRALAMPAELPDYPQIIPKTCRLQPLPSRQTNAPGLVMPVAPEVELIALVNAVADFHGFNPEQRAEAKQIALADLEAAPECFRDLAAKIPGIQPTIDDRITCNRCANLVGRKCSKWSEMGAVRGWEPVQLPLRCEQFRPKAGEADQHTGAERWPNLKRVDG